ncbi:MAG TPA: hypothetical protein VGE08_24395 [Steroidobacter sp.]|uniref:hypothetical protein n=1 Tax=Steroidobacter sp. TaxID=1978227 RepID=UPI002EDAA456
MLVRTLSISLLTAVCAVATAQAGTKLEMVNRDLSGSRTSTINTWAQNGMMRVETQPNRHLVSALQWLAVSGWGRTEARI